MKRIIALCMTIILTLCILSGCEQSKEKGNQTTNNTNTSTNGELAENSSSSNNYFNTEIKPSPDKYTWYIKNYVGRNCATIGYFTLGGFLNESYGEGYIKIIIIAEDGSFVDADTLKDYVVIEQSVAPNTELKYIFRKDEDGKESAYLIESQNIEEIEILVRRVGTK